MSRWLNLSNSLLIVICILDVIIITFLPSCGEKPTFTLDSGIEIYLDSDFPKRITKQKTAIWAAEVFFFWDLYNPKWHSCLLKSQNKTRIYFINQEKFKLGSIYASAYTLWPGDIYISRSKDTKSLFMHELSHIFVGRCGNIWETAHNFFKEVGYQY